MVGYQKDDSMTQNQKLIAGCISGAMTRFVTQPLDVVKLRTQVVKKIFTPAEQKKWFKITRSIYKEEGVTAFWQGHNLGQIHSVLSVSSQFYIYELTTKYTADLPVERKYRPIITYLCGVCSGCASAALVLPIEVIRVRQMLVKEQYKGLIRGARAVFKSGGIFAFYEGITASMLQMGPATGISFSVFSFLQPLILSTFKGGECDKCHHARGNAHRPEIVMLASTVAGSAAGFLSKSITYPFDLTKRRMQISSHVEENNNQKSVTSKNLVKCHSMLQCFIETYRNEGIKGFYKGWKITIYKAQLTSIVAFTTYELMCYTIREIEK
ncbi:hypothetical protein K1T71_000434 [Dendrolimus kikuchii]|uniref:Uncharacterized protein n=1 Tax=Dendrolimus kikuchii TaxID=765133 RepID=A0ACC1DJK2_9NEOP|nr:hypothetical protein K1T71_000434 [Dendrolimus kikuchii]